MIETNPARGAGRAWQVGALCKAIANSLDARFNPVTVVGEISGFVRASSGHCYFSMKDATGQLRCAMFRRAAGLLDFNPKDGELVEVRARLGVYEPRGELQLVVESMTKAGQGTLFEQFLQLKEKLEREGLFEAARKKPVRPLPRAIGVVTSLGAAAWHDTVTALRRRVPHVPVVLAPAAVQGAQAPGELIAALESLYAMVRAGVELDVILLVRGGGAMEDLWAFNDEMLARTIAASPVPVISGVGHETDFTIADFVADLRAPTPTAAAELAGVPTDALSDLVADMAGRVGKAALLRLDVEAQRLDRLAAQISRPSALIAGYAMQLARFEPRIGHAAERQLQARNNHLQRHGQAMPRLVAAALLQKRAATLQLTARLQALDPRRVLQRGFAWLVQGSGQALTRISQVHPQQALTATLVDGTVDLRVIDTRPN